MRALSGEKKGKERMSTTAESATIPTRRRKRVDGWRWAGRIFLALMLLYTAVPMIWMLLTSIKSGFAAMQFRRNGGPTSPRSSYQKLLDPQNSVGRTSCASSGTAFMSRP